MYYEQGFPLAAFAKVAKENDLKISWLNVAREFLQQGFSKQRIISEFRELLAFHENEIDIETISEFCDLGDEAQKEKLWEFWQTSPQFSELVEKYGN